MAQRSGFGRFLDSVKGLLSGSPAKHPTPGPGAAASPAEVRAAHEAAMTMYEEGRWRAALQALDAVNAGASTDPAALTLWMQCKASLGERAPVVGAFRTLLSLPGVGIEHLRDGYGQIGAEAQLELGPEYVARVDAAGLDSEARARALFSVPKALWPADRVFEALAASNETHFYDELLALARQRFPDDARLAQVKERPLDRLELQRRATEEARKQREAKKAARASFDQARKERRGGSAGETGAGLEAAVFAHRDDVQATASTATGCSSRVIPAASW